MELIVRTAHGTADVSFEVHDHDTTLRDLISAVTGQAAPNAALVDGRTVDTTERLTDCGLRIGSIIDTDLALATPPPPASVTLAQLTGPGAGTTRSLTDGEYRIGPGTRQNADELDVGTVAKTAFVLEVRAGRSPLITPPESSRDAPLHLDGQTLAAPTEWRHEYLIVDGRTFALEVARTPGSPLEPPRPAAPVDRHGRVLHNRPPRAPVDRRLLLVDAIRDGLGHRAHLWHARVDNGAPCSLVVGLDRTARTPVHIDLAAHRVVALTGHEATTTAHARALLIEATTTYGPSDLEVVIATTPERLARWEWTKWLPHTHVADTTTLLTDELELAVFALELRGRRSRRTMVIVDDDHLWSTPAAVLRRLVLDGPPEVTVVVLTETTAGAPSSCDAVVEFDGDDAATGAAQLVQLHPEPQRLDVLVPLPDVTTTLDLARSLAPLRDPDLPPLESPAVSERSPQTIAEFVGFRADGHGHGAAMRWGDDTSASAHADVEGGLPIGLVGDEPLLVDLALDRSVLISGSSIDEAVDVTRTLTLSAATAWSPADAAIVAVDHRPNPNEQLRRLPHFGGTFSDRGSAAARQFTERLRREVGGSSPRRHLVVLISEPAESESAAPGLLSGLMKLAADNPGVHLVVATSRPIAAVDDDLRRSCSFEISVDRVGGVRRATLRDRAAKTRTPFVPFTPPTTVTHAVHAHPYVIGRPPTPLERRLERREPSELTHGIGGRDVERLVTDLIALAGRHRIAAVPTLIPRLLADDVDTVDLFARCPGDGIPLGMIDASDADEPVPILWEPANSGSILLIGSPRSGVRAALDTMLHGAVVRQHPDRLRLSVIDQSDTRRAAVARFPHVDALAAPNQANTVLDPLIAAMGQRTAALERSGGEEPTPRWSAMLLVVRDVGRLGPDAAAQLQALVTGGSRVGIDVVCTAARPSDVAGLIEAFRLVLVGDLRVATDYAALAIDEPARLQRHPGRTVQLGTQRLVQLAAVSCSLEATLRSIAIAPATPSTIPLPTPPAPLPAPVSGAPEGTP
jgi:S-DNA-T family DNA segregation ATPase FtsK/SpoIIIE